MPSFAYQGRTGLLNLNSAFLLILHLVFVRYRHLITATPYQHVLNLLHICVVHLRRLRHLP